MKNFIYFSITIIFVQSLVISFPIQEENEVIEELNENDVGIVNRNSSNKIDFDINNEIIDLSHLDRSIFGKPDNEITASRLFNYNINKTENPEELGTYFEGDILIPFTSGRNGLLSIAYRWPNNAIPYVVEGSFTPDELSKLQDGINEYHSKTCIRFIPRTKESDYIAIVNDNSGCWSSIGKIGGRQAVNLQTPACLARGSGTFMHELMHVVGFLHEHSRYERDDYIDIKYENIDKKSIDNFSKVNSNIISAFGVPYDYGSILHYSSYAFSVNGQATIIPKNPTNSMGQRNGFSSYDITKINAMYKCNDQFPNQSTVPTNANNNVNNNNMSISSSFLSLLGLCSFFSC